MAKRKSEVKGGLTSWWRLRKNVKTDEAVLEPRRGKTMEATIIWRIVGTETKILDILRER